MLHRCTFTVRSRPCAEQEREKEFGQWIYFGKSFIIHRDKLYHAPAGEDPAKDRLFLLISRAWSEFLVKAKQYSWSNVEAHDFRALWSNKPNELDTFFQNLTECCSGDIWEVIRRYSPRNGGKQYPCVFLVYLDTQMAKFR